MNEHTLESLTEEKNRIINDLKEFAVLDPQTNRWTAVPAHQDFAESDPNDRADRLEEYDLRNANVTTLQQRLDAIETNILELSK